MPKLIVTTSSGALIGQHHIAVIGQREKWTISSSNGVVTGLSITLNVIPAVIGDYKIEDGNSYATPFLVSGMNATFYWIQTGAITITIKALVSGQPALRKIEAQVLTPNVVEYIGTTSRTEIYSSVLPGREAHAEDETISMLRFGSTDKPGISFSAKVSMPTKIRCTGKLFMMQTMTVNRKKTTTLNSFEHAHTDDSVLDQEVYYGQIHSDKDKSFIQATSGLYVFESEDSPATTLGKSGANRTYKNVEVDEKYCMYIMFCPKDGISVAIAELFWRWQATATFNETSGSWTLQIGGDSSEVRYLQGNRDRITLRLPIWRDNSATELESDT
ncbi:hypothetical protein ACIGKM_10345 [Ectopseudomonas toyotomiensis]|uniref:hypothetical protein n=1 Tax=Ectopseudomonas toyotomiensis TaxID=554344 RepID=UPI0037C722D0